MIAARMDEKAGKATGYLACLIAGWLACSWWYGTLHLKQEEKALPAAMSVAGCQAKGFAEAKRLAQSDTIVDTSMLPKCPPLAAVKSIAKK